MKKIYYDLLYLTACGVNQIKPSDKCLENYINNIEGLENLYKVSCRHFLESLVGMTLKNAGVILIDEWNERISKAIRKSILFEVERNKIFSFMEQNNIWYLALKGIILEKYYPVLGMRQMSDNDILFDSEYADNVKKYMVTHGYTAVSVGKGNHDVYKKKPIYNFELHRALYGKIHNNSWVEYYSNIKDRLIKNENKSFEYYMSYEDFYVYIMSHAFKHYNESGTGIRSLLDFYVYLQREERILDFSYIERECEVLGIAEFEKNSRQLCKKVFSQNIIKAYEPELFEMKLSNKENEKLYYYLTSGVYGTVDHMVDKNLKKYKNKEGKISKIKYIFRRIFPDEEFIRKYYPFFNKHKYLIPVLWMRRFVRLVVNKKRRKKISRELKFLSKK